MKPLRCLCKVLFWCSKRSYLVVLVLAASANKRSIDDSGAVLRLLCVWTVSRPLVLAIALVLTKRSLTLVIFM